MPELSAWGKAYVLCSAARPRSAQSGPQQPEWQRSQRRGVSKTLSTLASSCPLSTYRGGWNRRGNSFLLLSLCIRHSGVTFGFNGREGPKSRAPFLFCPFSFSFCPLLKQQVRAFYSLFSFPSRLSERFHPWIASLPRRTVSPGRSSVGKRRPIVLERRI